MRTTPAQRHRMRIEAAKMALVAASIGTGDEISPANDNAAGEAATGYERMLGQLAHDRRQLKQLQSIERKIELKRVLVAEYVPWISGALAEAKASGSAAQDEVVATLMTWFIDIGEYGPALEIAEHVLRHRLSMPDHFQRQPGCYLAEEIADAAIKALQVEKPFPADVLEHVEILVDGEDMPDQVKAKLHKALGLSFIARASAEQPEGQAIAGFPRSAWTEAKAHLLRALELNEKVGVKKDLERIERELKKIEDPAAKSS